MKEERECHSAVLSVCRQSSRQRVPKRGKAHGGRRKYSKEKESSEAGMLRAGRQGQV